MKLVTAFHLNVEERRSLGGFVTREEIREAVLRGLREHGHFPPHARPWKPGHPCYEGGQLLAVPQGVRLLMQRSHPADPLTLAEAKVEDFDSEETAVDHYVASQIGSRYDGLPVR